MLPCSNVFLYKYDKNAKCGGVNLFFHRGCNMGLDESVVNAGLVDTEYIQYSKYGSRTMPVNAVMQYTHEFFSVLGIRTSDSSSFGEWYCIYLRLVSDSMCVFVAGLGFS